MNGITTYLYESLLTDIAKLSVSSQAAGITTNGLMSGTGSASLLTGGSFSGIEELLYTILISNIIGGQAVGQAKYSWRESSLASGAWAAEDVTTHSDLQALNNDVMVAFEGGDAPHFSTAQQYTFRALPTFGAANMLTPDRGSLWRSDELQSPVTITYDCETSKIPTALVLYSHNLSDVATVTLKGVDDIADWATPDVQVSLTVAETIIEYLTVSACRYWRLEITDDTNSDGYIEIGYWYLGGFQQPTENAVWGAEQNLEFHGQNDSNEYGVKFMQVYSRQEIIKLDYENISADDVALIRNMALTLYDVDGDGHVDPVLLHLFSDENDYIYLVDLIGEIPRSFEWKDMNNISLEFEEVVDV